MPQAIVSILIESVLRPTKVDIRALDEIIALVRSLSSGQLQEESGNIQALVEGLDKCMSCLTSSDAQYNPVLRRLQALCRYADHLPAACYLQGDAVVADIRSPIHQSALSDVYQGLIGTVQVALKVPRLSRESKLQVKKDALSEVMVWRWLRHPNIVYFLGVSTFFDLSLVSIWMSHGNVQTYLKNNPKSNRSKLVRDIILGLDYLHSINIIHGDLKAANVLVDRELRACLTDFGLAVFAGSSVKLTTSNLIGGTIRWMSPELLSLEDSTVAVHTTASDRFALAMTMWEIYTGRVPYDDIQNDTVVAVGITRNIRPKRPPLADAPELDDCVWNVMQWNWMHDPAQRVSLKATLRDLSPRPPSSALLTKIKPQPVSTVQSQAKTTSKLDGGSIKSSPLPPDPIQLEMTSELARRSIDSFALSSDSTQLVVAGATPAEGTTNAASHWSLIEIHALSNSSVRCRDYCKEGFVCRLAWSPDSTQIAAALDGGALILLNPTDLSLASRFSPHSMLVSELAWSPDSLQLASGSQDSPLRLWDPVTRHSRVPDRTVCVSAIAYSLDGSLVASGSPNGAVRLWNPITGQAKMTIRPTPHENKPIRSLAFHPGTTQLVVSDGVLYVWDIKRYTCVRTLARHAHVATVVAFSSDGKHIFSGFETGRVICYDFAANQQVRVLQASSSGATEIRQLAVSSHYIAIVGRDSGFEYWKVEGGSHKLIASTSSSLMKA